MRQLEIRLSLPAVAPLLARLEPLAGELRDTLANPVVRAQDDPDFIEFHASELLGGQRSDLAALAALFDEEFHRSGRIVIAQENADRVLRACAALRLRLRERELGFANDAQLESGEPDFDRMSEADHIAYGCYVVLATLQELIIDHLFSGATDDEEEEEDEDLDEDIDYDGDAEQ